MFHWFRARGRSLRYAFRGIGLMFAGQVNIRIHVVAAVLAVVLGFLFRIDTCEWLAVVLSISGVMAAEAFNTAVEKLTDLVSPDFDSRAGQVKDMAAAAVLIASAGALIVGAIVFLPRIIYFFLHV